MGVCKSGRDARELRAAIGVSRERLEAGYEFLLEHPPLGLAVQRHGEELSLVTAPESASSIERHLGTPRPVALSTAATEVLAIVAHRQPNARAGIELVRGSASDSALDTLLQRGLVAHNQHHLLVTTQGFLDCAGLRDLADLPPVRDEEGRRLTTGQLTDGLQKQWQGHIGLGFDARESSLNEQVSWPPQRRTAYLLQPHVRRPCSEDRAVWPSASDVDELLQVPGRSGPIQSLWDDLTRLKSQLDRAQRADATLHVL